jgi:RNA polymerase sigma-70 factor (ECF subfamily)
MSRRVRPRTWIKHFSRFGRRVLPVEEARLGSAIHSGEPHATPSGRVARASKPARRWRPAADPNGIEAQGNDIGTEARYDQGLFVRLLERIATGDSDAFGEFYRHTNHRVRSLAQRITGDYGIAEETSQEVYLQVWMQADSYRATLSTPIGWLMMLTQRRAIDRCRAEKAAIYHEITWYQREQHRNYDPVAETVDRRLDAERVLRAIGALTAAQWEAIAAVYFGEFTQREASQLLDIPLGTVKSRIREGIHRLQADLAGSGHELTGTNWRNAPPEGKSKTSG